MAISTNAQKEIQDIFNRRDKIVEANNIFREHYIEIIEIYNGLSMELTDRKKEIELKEENEIIIEKNIKKQIEDEIEKYKKLIKQPLTDNKKGWFFKKSNSNTNEAQDQENMDYQQKIIQLQQRLSNIKKMVAIEKENNKKFNDIQKSNKDIVLLEKKIDVFDKILFYVNRKDRSLISSIVLGDLETIKKIALIADKIKNHGYPSLSPSEQFEYSNIINKEFSIGSDSNGNVSIIEGEFENINPNQKFFPKKKRRR